MKKMDNAEREPVEEHSAEDKPVRTRKSQKVRRILPIRFNATLNVI